MKLPKLNQKGFGLHAILPVLVILIVSVIGVRLLTASKAAVVDVGGGGGYTNGKIYSGKFTINQDGTGLNILSSPPDGFVKKYSNMSFDGTQVAYFDKKTDKGAIGKIYKGTISSNGLIINTSAFASLPSGAISETPPLWSPDGNKVAVVLSTDSGREIWIFRKDGSIPHKVLNVPATVTDYISWLPGSENIMYEPDYAVYYSDRKICTISTGGEQNTCYHIDITDAVLGDLAVSPAGDRIALAINRFDAYGKFTIANIWIAKTDGSDLKRRTWFSQGEFAKAIVWSPDGTKIAFLLDSSSSSTPSDTGLYVINADGGSKQKISSDQLVWPPSLSWAHK